MKLALWHAALRGLGVWQMFPAIAVLASPGVRAPVALIAAHLLVMLVCLISALRRWPAVPCLLANYVVIAADYAATVDPGSALAFAAVWSAALSCATPVLVIRPGAALGMSLGSIAALGTAQILLQPDWPRAARLIAILSALALFVGASIMARVMRRAADRSDAQTERLQQAVHREAAVQRTGRALVEDSRLLHDTVLNTLAAIADGDAARVAPQAIRDRCAQDVSALREIVGGEGEDLAFSIEELARRSGIEIEMHGSTPGELERLESLLPAEASTAIRRAIAELVANAAKHSGTDHVTIDAEVAAGRVTIAVTDTGAGFDGELRPGRGLAESVFARCAEAGVQVELRAAPGQGTTARLSYLLGDEGSQRETSDRGEAALDIDGIGRSGSLVAAGMVVLADLALVAVRPATLAAVTAVSAAVIGGLVVMAWRWVRAERRFPRWFTALVVLSVPLAFSLSFAVVMAHEAALSALPAILLNAPLLILLSASRPQQLLRAALIGLGVAVVVMCALQWRIAPELVLLPIIAVCPQLGLFSGWLAFRSVFAEIATQQQSERRRAMEAEARTASGAALMIARKRWLHAGAQASSVLLARIADGELDPHSAAVRQRCAEEGDYLRQLLEVNTELKHLSPWLVFALIQSRTQGVSLRIRSGAIDAPDAESARRFGRALLAAIDGCTPGEAISVGLFSEQGEQVALILGPSSIAERVRGTDAFGDEHHEYQVDSMHALVLLRARSAGQSIADPPRPGTR